MRAEEKGSVCASLTSVCDCFASHTFCRPSEGKVSLSFFLKHFERKFLKHYKVEHSTSFLFSFLLLFLLLHLFLLFLADLLFSGASMPRILCVLYTQLSRFFFIGQWLDFQHNKGTHKNKAGRSTPPVVAGTSMPLLFPRLVRASGQDSVHGITVHRNELCNLPEAGKLIWSGTLALKKQHGCKTAGKSRIFSASVLCCSSHSALLCGLYLRKCNVPIPGSAVLTDSPQ